MSDQDLVARAQAGQTHAFGLLVERHQDIAFSVALRLCGDRETAREVTQKAFIRAWRGIGSFRHDARFSTWLHRIVVNTANSHLGRRSTTEPIEAADDAIDTVFPDGFEALRREERVRWLRAGLAALNEIDAIVLTSFYLEERSIAEVAEATGLTEANVKVRLHRARGRLRRELKRTMNTDDL